MQLTATPAQQSTIQRISPDSIKIEEANNHEQDAAAEGRSSPRFECEDPLLIQYEPKQDATTSVNDPQITKVSKDGA